MRQTQEARTQFRSNRIGASAGQFGRVRIERRRPFQVVDREPACMPTMDAPAFPSQNNRALLHPATSDACPVKHRHAPTRFASPLPVGRGRRGHDTEKFLNSLAPRRVGACCRRNARRHPPLSPWPSLRGEKGTETGASVGPELFGCFRGYVLRAETATGQARRQPKDPDFRPHGLAPAATA